MDSTALASPNSRLPPIVVVEVEDSSDSVKQVWGKPSNVNGNDAATANATPVMDTASWPALPSQKSASSDSIKPLTGATVPSSQETGVAPLSLNKHVPNTPNLNPTPNQVANTRQRSMKRGSTNDPSSPQPHATAVEMAAVKLGNNSGESSSHKEGGQKGGIGNDYQPQRSNSFNRKGGNGQHPRGDGSYHHSYPSRRDQDRGNLDFSNPHRSFGSRDNHMQQQRGAPRGYPRAPHASPTLFSPQPPLPLHPYPYPGHMVYPTEGPPPFVVVPGPPESIRAMPIMYYPIPDHQLHMKIVKQIDYYFSNENLVKDTYLRQNMDEQGWVPIKLIAGFKKVMSLTDDMQLILHAVHSSTVVEVQNDKIRKRNEWMKWIMPPGNFSLATSPQARAMSGDNMLVGQLEGVTLDGKVLPHGHSEMFNRSSSGEYNIQLRQYGSEGAVQTGSECKTPAGSPSK